MTTTPTEPAALTASVEVTVPPAQAFEVFTAGMATWWPLVDHSAFGLEAADVRMAPEVGGQIVERGRGGATNVWGTVLTWLPPDRVAFTWHPAGDPGRATRITVRFAPTPDGTKVVLVHDDWANRADDDAAYLEYEAGWPGVLALYATATR